MEKFLAFVQHRLTHLVDFQKAKHHQDQWLAGLKLLEPCIPESGFVHYGDIEHFPPRLRLGEVMIIVLNHQSDLDWAILMALMHTGFIPRTVKPISNSSAKMDVNLPAPYQTIKPVAFTHAHFETVPVIGDIVKTNLIGLSAGMTDEEIQERIQKRLDEGFNTFVLFPEGRIHDKSNHENSQKFWSSQPEYAGQKYPFQNCVLPRHRAWDNLIKTVGERLKYLVDFTILYPDYKPWLNHWNYDKKYSIVYSWHNRIPPILTHTKIYDLQTPIRSSSSDHPRSMLKHSKNHNQKTNDVEAQEQQQQQPSHAELLVYLRKMSTLLRLWKQKEKRLNRLRMEEFELSGKFK